MAPLLELRRVTVGYGNVPVLSGLDLAVERGEIVALLGANGSGKTTTMLAIAGELRPSAGTVRLDGQELRGPLHRRARRGITMITDDRGLFMKLTVLDNLRLGPGSVESAIDVLPELAPLLRRPVGLLSGGEQQMVSVARALAAGPRLLLVDELSLGLAPMVVDRLLESIAGAAMTGTGVLLVEQHAAKALAVAHRGCVLRRGKIVLEGSSADLLNRFGDVEHAYLHGLADDGDDLQLTTRGPQ
jgi:branched-chain amino acid transport system ATP-binding protein